MVETKEMNVDILDSQNVNRTVLDFRIRRYRRPRDCFHKCLRAVDCPVNVAGPDHPVAKKQNGSQFDLHLVMNINRYVSIGSIDRVMNVN